MKMRWKDQDAPLLLALVLLVPTVSALHTPRYQPRTPTVRCCAPDLPYTSYAESAGAAVAAALADGKRRLTVEAFAPSDQAAEAQQAAPPSPFIISPPDEDDTFDDEVPFTVAMACARSLLNTLEAPVLLLLPTSDAVEAAQLCAADWSAEERERLRPAAIGTCHPNDVPDYVKLGAVVLSSLSIDASSPYLRDAQAWLRQSKIAVCVNTRVPLLPFEEGLFSNIFALVPHAIRRQLLRYEALRMVGGFLSERIYVTPPARARLADTAARAATVKASAASAQGMAGAAGMGPIPTNLVRTDDFGTALLALAYPGPWRIYLDAGSSGKFELLDELTKRPSGSELTELVLPDVKRRRAALGAALRALQGDGGEAVVDGRVAATGPGKIMVEEATEGGLARELVVSLTWKEITKSGEALSLYQQGALLRQRVYGRDVKFAADEDGVHILQPFAPEEAAAMRAVSEGYMRLNGDVRGACVLVPDANGEEGVCVVEGLAIQRDVSDKEERSACASLLLGKAEEAAKEREQEWLVVPALPPSLQVQGSEWLKEAGFAPAEGVEGINTASRVMKGGAMAKRV